MLGEIATADTNDGYAEIRTTNRAGSEQLSVHSKNKGSKVNSKVTNGFLDDTHNHVYEEEPASSNGSLILDDDLGLHLDLGIDNVDASNRTLADMVNSRKK